MLHRDRRSPRSPVHLRANLKGQPIEIVSLSLPDSVWSSPQRLICGVRHTACQPTLQADLASARGLKSAFVLPILVLPILRCGVVPVKCGVLDGRIVQAAPEYDACRELGSTGFRCV